MWRPGGTLVAVLGALILAGGCARHYRAAPGREAPPRRASEEGIASWYGPGFHGQRTTSGQVYDQTALTAAHRTLPLGTRVSVTNLRNGRVVEVLINDRGPFVGDRVIDVSYAAALMLDMIGPGTAPVRIDLLSGSSATMPTARYEVQVGSFADEARAEELSLLLRSRFEDVHVTTFHQGTQRFRRVRLGPYAQRAHAVRAAEHVMRLGFPALIVEEERQRP
jgi:rare lipoprotein A